MNLRLLNLQPRETKARSPYIAIYMVGVSSDAVEATSTPEEPESLVDKFVVEENAENAKS